MTALILIVWCICIAGGLLTVTGAVTLRQAIKAGLTVRQFKQALKMHDARGGRAVKKLRKNEILVLRSCGTGGSSRDGFVWPLTVGAVVEAPDWQDTDNCGHGLHGLPWGQGGDYCDRSAPVWLVLRVNTAKGNYQHGTGNMLDKCKFRVCTVEGVFDNPKDATDMILAYAPAGTVCNYATGSSGYGGTSTSGNWGTSTSGDRGTSTSGYGGTSTSGNDGTLCWRVWDGNHYRLHVRYVGEDGIKANTPYRYEHGQIVEVVR